MPPQQWRFSAAPLADGADPPPPLPAPLHALGAARGPLARGRLLRAVLADRASRRWLSFKAAEKLVIVIALTLRKAATILLSSMVVMYIVLIAQEWVDVGTLPIVDLAVMALAAHWLGWTDTVTKFLGGKPKADATTPPPAPPQSSAKPQE